MNQRWTYHHQLDRVGHVPHGGLQDVMVEDWGQYPPVLEPHMPLQQERTILWATVGCVWGSGRQIRGVTGDCIGGTKIVRRRYVTGKVRKASTMQESEFPKWLFH